MTLAARIFGTPLMVAPRKLDAILGAPDIAQHLGLRANPLDGPEAASKERGAVAVMALPGKTQGRPISVAVVQVVGTLTNRASWLGAMSGITSYETLADEIQRLAADPSVDGILLEVDSFGGEAAGCFDAADAIRAARDTKPIFGVANQYAMSAGYGLLSQASKVFVPQSGEIGSIGVVTTHVDYSAAAEKEGVRVTHVHAGARKVDMSPFKALSAEARERLQADVGQIYDQFVAAVEGGRGASLPADKARATEALTYIGEKAVQAGLADHVGNKAAALDALVAELEDRRMDKELAEKAAKFEARALAAEAELAEMKKADVERLKKADADFLEEIKAKAAEMQAPIDAADLARVKAHFDAGRRDVAHEVGELLLRAAQERGGKAFTRTPATPTEATSHEAGAKRGVERLRARRGANKNKQGR